MQAASGSKSVLRHNRLRIFWTVLWASNSSYVWIVFVSYWWLTTVLFLYNTHRGTQVSVLNPIKNYCIWLRMSIEYLYITSHISERLLIIDVREVSVKAKVLQTGKTENSWEKCFGLFQLRESHELNICHRFNLQHK